MTTSPVTICGNLVRDPEIRFTQTGLAKAQFTVAVNESYTPRGGERQEKTHFVPCIAWRELAENIGDSITQGIGQGARVVVTGRLEQVRWETDQGEHRSMVQLVVEDIGPSLRFATSSYAKRQREQSGRTVMNEPPPQTGVGEDNEEDVL